MLLKKLNKIKNLALPDKQIMNEIFRMNVNRVFYLSVISAVTRLFSIINFLSKSPAEYQGESIWRTGIIISHAVYLILLIIFSLLTFKLRKNDRQGLLSAAVQYVATALILLFGVLITSIDQLVTPSITPFTIACIAFGAIFIIKPLYALLMVSSGYLLFYFALGIVQPNPVVLLSNRLNGLTSALLGFFLSLVLWNSIVVNLQLKERILLQQKELEDKNRELEHLATHDSLTGLINRRCFEEKALSEMRRIKRHGNDSCLLLLDIDNFKGINDKYGHPAGDKVLQRLASIMTSQLRETDVVARIGGEEFAIILINAVLKDGQAFAEKLRKRIEDEIFVIGGQKIAITVSIGVTSLDNGLDSYEQAYSYADIALYTSKSNGKNRVAVEAHGDVT